MCGMENKVTIFWMNGQTYPYQSQVSSNWNRISVFSDKRCKIHLITTHFWTDFLSKFSTQHFQYWGMKWLTVHLSDNCTFREIWSCFNENLNHLLSLSSIPTYDSENIFFKLTSWCTRTCTCHFLIKLLMGYVSFIFEEYVT